MGYFCEDGKAEFDELQMNIGLGNINIIDDEIDDIKNAIINEGIYKNWDAFQKENTICYIPELHAKIYTRETFYELANGIDWLAEFLFETVSWQDPSTLLDEWERSPDVFGIKHYTEIFDSNECIKEIKTPEILTYKGMDFNRIIYWRHKENDKLFNKKIKSDFLYEFIGKLFNNLKSNTDSSNVIISENFNVEKNTLYLRVKSKTDKEIVRYSDEFYFKLIKDE